MKFRYFILLLLCSQICITPSCKKENKTKPDQGQQGESNQVLANGLTAFSIQDQLFEATINTALNIVDAVVPDSVSMSKIKINFTLANNTYATINNIKVKNGDVVDFSNEITMLVKSNDNKQSASYKINLQNELQYHGLGRHLVGGKSLNRSYDFYFDQFDGSTYAPVNCGPTVVTMALKWGDAKYALKPVDARNMIQPTGGWCNTSQLESYLRQQGLNNATYSLNNLEETIKRIIDNNDVAILCLDMYVVDYNEKANQHTNKFYNTTTRDWGHFLLVKGYKQVDGTFYLEVYDPYSNNVHYISPESFGQVVGKDRYYTSTAIKRATDAWWPYVIEVAPKGKKVPVVLIATKGIKTFSTIPVAYGR